VTEAAVLVERPNLFLEILVEELVAVVAQGLERTSTSSNSIALSSPVGNNVSMHAPQYAAGRHPSAKRGAKHVGFRRRDAYLLRGGRGMIEYD
jgi:hypothetical protein